MREFFGFGGYQRTPEGYMSWQHLVFVTSLMVIMVADKTDRCSMYRFLMRNDRLSHCRFPQTRGKNAKTAVFGAGIYGIRAFLSYDRPT